MKPLFPIRVALFVLVAIFCCCENVPTENRGGKYDGKKVTYAIDVEYDPECFAGVSVGDRVVSEAAEGETVTLVATEGYDHVFDSWEVTSGNTLLKDPGQQTTSFVMPAEAVSVTANFSLKQNTITIQTKGEGRAVAMIAGEEVHQAKTGVEVSLVATPDSGSVFLGWELKSGRGAIRTPYSNPATLEPGGGEVVIEATFTAKTYRLSVGKVDEGEARATLAGVSFVEARVTSGTEVTISATPKEGYVFSRWRVTAGKALIADPTARITTMVMPSESVEITPEYTSSLHTISLTTDGNGEVFAMVGTEYVSSARTGQEVTITTAPAEGFVFRQWSSISGVEIDPAQSTATFKMPANDISLKAEFTRGEYVLINGVKWATANVEKFGEFAASPQDKGLLYQWGRNVGWSTSDPMTSYPPSMWDGSISAEKEFNPCPAGWRLPTREEVETLIDTYKVSYEFKGIAWSGETGNEGGTFTDIKSGASVFFPTLTYRNDKGTLCGGLVGEYWTQTELFSGFNINYSINYEFSTGSKQNNYALAVRCVIDTKIK